MTQDGVKDRIQLKSKIVMDKSSRPSKEDMKEVTETFTYIEVLLCSFSINTHLSKGTPQISQQKMRN